MPSSRAKSRLARRSAIAIAATSGAVALGVSVVKVFELARLMSGRVAFPYDLEWMEGGQLYHAHRLLEGVGVYQNCSDGFLPFPYPPIHALLLASMGAIFGLGFTIGRALSVVAFVISSLIVARAVWGDGRPRGRRLVLTAVALGGIAASFPVTGAWYDLIRVDSVYFALLMSGATLALPPRRRAGSGRTGQLPWPRMLACAACLSAAVFAKQTAVFFLPWISLYAVWRHGRRGLWLGVLIAAAIAIPGAILLLVSDGFFWTMMMEVMGRHPLLELQARGAAIGTLLFAPCLVLVPFATVWLSRRKRLDRDLAYWLGLLLTAAVASIVTTAKVGAFTNNMLTVCVLAWPVSAMVVDRLLDAIPRHKLQRALVATASALFAARFLSLHPIETFITAPTAAHRQSVRALEQIIGGLDGGVIAPGHSYLAVRNGHRNAQIHEQGYIDIMGAAVEEVDVIACLRQLDAKWLVVDDASQLHMRMLLGLAYRPHEPLPKIARTPVGMYTRPVMLFERIPDAPVNQPRTRVRPLFDFEEGRYDGWTRGGEAFDWGPSTAFNGFQAPVAGQRGRYFADSYHPRLLDAATGWLQSPLFTIDRSHLSLRIGGGRSQRLRVELMIDGRVRRQHRGRGKNFELMGPVTWDVAPFQDQRAQIKIVDDEIGGWGHLMVDAIELYDAPTEAAD
jgi:hypothetical protein